jgi:hypothetical protein
MTHDRDLACAIALGDMARAGECLDIMVREEMRPDEEQVALGRVDALNIQRRQAVKPALKKAA